jgi:glutathione S-transferase
VGLLLYENPVSTCSQKVRITLAEKGLSYDRHVIDWNSWEHLSDWYLAINPNGVVPSLVHNGEPVIESSVICEYLDELFPNPPLTPRSALGRAKMRAWMRYLEEVPTVAIRAPSYNAVWVKTLKNNVSPEQYDAMTEKMPLRKHFYRQMGDTGFSPERIAESKERLRQTLQRLSSAIEVTKTFILGDEYSLADILMVPNIVRMEDLGLSELWADIPLVQAWYDRVKSRPSFTKAYMPGSRLHPDEYVASALNKK